jgi:hypothetical protein
MKGMGLLATVWLLSASAVSAQAPASDIVRPDLAGSIGWLHANKSSLDSYNDWYNRGLQGAVTLGWYWSTHVKTEVEASASTRGDFYASRTISINGFPAHVFSEYSFVTRRITVGQQYQFGENAWFHPHLGAGLDLNWETVSRRDQEVVLYNPATRQHGGIVAPVERPEETDLHVRPYVSAGFKAYVTPRAFVRSDTRLVLGKRLEDVVVRFGVGVDF